jgi:threonine/homoserine/homoserine lactone efflux protein
MREGRSAAVVSAFGQATASVAQAIAAALGLSALFVYSPLALAIIKYCGPVYLVYLGVRGFVSGGIAGLAAQTESAGRPSLAVLHWQGLLTDLLNPN